MYFKSLELYGFKSFAGKTKIDFEPGVTAIVGPNGCGKSNCVDALKWVLGEQSAKDLRGANMEDVIFNGTDTKDPVGFAEVSLTLSNESKFLPIEYDEVVITRRLFRSGDSEYLLNKNQVRLKDILELFMGTGVGTSAYSIIEQGKIDMIISSRPEDRRYIFEEASGIIKYKSKKKEAVRKLEYTENNLLRVSDIIEEVRRQIGSIERQARKAERYKEEFERLKGMDTKIAFLEFKRLSEERQGLERETADIKNGEKAMQAEVSELGAKLGMLRARQTDIDAKLSGVQLQELSLTSNIARSRDKIGLDEERLRELEQLKGSLLNEQTIAKKNISELEEKVSAFSKEVDNISGGRSQKENLVNERRLRFKKLEDDLKENEHNVRTGKLKIVDLLSLHSKTRNDVVKASSDLSNLQARERRLRLEEEGVRRELAFLQEQSNLIDKELGEIEKKIESARAIEASLEAELNNKETSLNQTDKAIEELKMKSLSLESKLTLLKEMVGRYEGFGAGAKAILGRKQEDKLGIPGVYGALAELINVKKGYEAAVEASLGELLQCIVVEDKKAAIDLINYLKQNNLGKATIVPLDLAVWAVSEGEPPVIQDKVIGRLGDFVETDAKFRGLISVLFADVYLVRDMDGLLHISSDSIDDAAFATTDGDIFRNGFFTGGANQEDSSGGILNRKIQIEKLEAELKEVKRALTALDERKSSLTKEGYELLDRLNPLLETLKGDELMLANKRNQRDNIGASIKKAGDELSLLALEITEVLEDIKSSKARQERQEAQLKCLDGENSAIQNMISTSQDFIEKANKEKEGLLVEITRLETELAGVAEQERNFLANLRMQDELLYNQRQLLSEKEKTFDDASIREEELRNEINALRHAIEGAEIEKAKASLELQDIKAKRSELETLSGQAGSEFKEGEKALNVIKDKLHILAMSGQEHSFKLEALKNRINQAYKIELEALSVDIEGGFNLEAANNEVRELRQRIDRMGPVNLVAIEEHQELKGRYDLLTRQKEDLINAKESLLEAIRKINKTTRELFMDTFQKVRLEFREYFRFLFGGGQAELILMDDQDVLECGIEIMARPPGKKLQSISLLSGGEKALTAIALLFSIFKVKPSPFCILDEVDAPLDESNIGRFTKLLSEFTKSSQFIMITHNKKTISMADVMYGVTMEESGVSKVVSVKFAKDSQKAQTVT